KCLGRFNIKIICNNARALSGQLERDGSTNAAPCARDQRDLTLELFSHGARSFRSFALRDSNDGATDDLCFVILIEGLDMQTHAPLAADIELLCHSATTGNFVAKVRDTEKAHLPLAQLVLAGPSDQHPAEPRHAEHAVS